jgi:hypothetical protein
MKEDGLLVRTELSANIPLVEYALAIPLGYFRPSLAPNHHPMGAQTVPECKSVEHIHSMARQRKNGVPQSIHSREVQRGLSIRFSVGARVYR